MEEDEFENETGEEVLRDEEQEESKETKQTLGEEEREEKEEVQQQQQLEHHQRQKKRRERQEEERERVKLRERQRRAVTSRILSGLRRQGNYGLPTRADINDVLTALAREAGWTVLPDGSTFRSTPTPHAPASSGSSLSMTLPPVGWGLRMATPFLGSPILATSTKGSSSLVPLASLESGIEVKHGEISTAKGSLTLKLSTKLKRTTSSQSRLIAALHGVRGVRASVVDTGSSVGLTMEGEEDPEKDLSEELKRELPKEPERDFAGTPYIPIYVMLPLSTINMQNKLDDPEGLMQGLKILKSANVDGVMVDCWWGLVEAEAPQSYHWSGYGQLLTIVREAQLKLQVVMSFHQCGGNVGDDVNILLPRWVLAIGEVNPDIFFTDREGRRNPESLSWGVDKERVLRGRTGIEVYFDYMRSFRQEFDEFFEDGTIVEIEVGLGPCGELRYPSYPEKHGWKYPGIGEFQCYDKYLQKNLRKAAEIRGHPEWAKGPHNAGQYNSRPQDTDFFRDAGDWDSYYGRFFLRWYSQVLIDHGDRVLSLANLAFEGTKISAKISGIHWWYKTASHAAELVTGFNNSCNRDGYALIANMFKRQNTTFNFTCVELRTLSQTEDYPEALADPEGLVWQVLNAAWDACIHVASENALPCYDREGYNKILENAKPRKNPDGRHLAAFTYLRLNSALLEKENFLEFERFVKRLHGEAVFDLQL